MRWIVNVPLVDIPTKRGRLVEKETVMKIVITVGSDRWTQEDAQSFLDWIKYELAEGNAWTDDDTQLIDYQIVHAEER